MTEGSDVVKALAVALPKIANPGKDGKSHHGKYTTLGAVLDHVKPVLAEHGLAIMQTMDGDGVRTLIVHESGDVFDAGTYPVGSFANPQTAGFGYLVRASVRVDGGVGCRGGG